MSLVRYWFYVGLGSGCLGVQLVAFLSGIPADWCLPAFTIGASFMAWLETKR